MGIQFQLQKNNSKLIRNLLFPFINHINFENDQDERRLFL